MSPYERINFWNSYNNKLQFLFNTAHIIKIPRVSILKIRKNLSTLKTC